MTRDEANKRLVLSRHTIGIYERMGTPAGPLDATMQLIGDEIAFLQEIVADHPTKAGTVGKLIERYQAMQGRVRNRAH